MFYDRFYELCQKKGVTPAKVARDIGIGQSTIAMWKIQGTTPNAKTVAALAKYFDVSQYYLLTGETEVHMCGVKDIDNMDVKETRRILLAYAVKSRNLNLSEQINLYTQELNEEGRKKVLERIQELLEIPKYRFFN